MNSSKSNLFLIELILGIMFFAVIAAVCIELFSASYKMEENSSYMAVAVNEASNVAEVARNSGFDNMDAYRDILGMTVESDKAVKTNEYGLTSTITQSLEDENTYNILITDEEEQQVYSLLVKRDR